MKKITNTAVIKSPSFGIIVAGAAGTAAVGALLARKGWAPKIIAGSFGLIGAALTWKAPSPLLRSFGAGAMTAAGSQLVLMLVA
jgi:hypothetical protein